MAAAPRPYWKGYLKLSLVSCPVALYSATSSSERVAFRQINRKTGNRLRQQLIDDETREPVEAEDKARGFETGKNAYVIVEDDEMNAIAIESSHTIDIDAFVPRAQIDERYIDTAYYIAPTDKVGQEAFAVIRTAMDGKDVVALGRVVLGKRERVIMLQPWEKGVLGTTLHYTYEVREAGAVFGDIPDIKIEKELLTLADHIVESKRADFDPARFRDRFEEAVVEMLKGKQGEPVVERTATAPARNVINLVDALRRSLAQEKAAAPEPVAKAKKPARKPSTSQREMLLPIDGKKAEAKAAKSTPADAAKAAKAPAAKRKAG